ncbi:MAG: 30S ribosomal protein S27ae [Thaumarchaeota archaeon]|nr:30S ribosomal protein S27ae [Nitrososphaerota archaeon]
MSEQKQPQQPQQKKKKVSPQVWKFYKVSGAELTRLKKECPRCGKGFFLAEHRDRLTCGNCGYSSFKSK